VAVFAPKGGVRGTSRHRSLLPMCRTGALWFRAKSAQPARCTDHFFLDGRLIAGAGIASGMFCRQRVRRGFEGGGWKRAASASVAAARKPNGRITRGVSPSAMGGKTPLCDVGYDPAGSLPPAVFPNEP